MSIAVLPVCLAIVAPFIGSFLGVLAERLPEGRPVAMARSQCDRCGAVLQPVDLVPLASWFWLRGRCRHCGAGIGVFPLFMEIAAPIPVMWAAMATSGWVFVATCVLGWMLLALAVIDWRAFLLPDVLTAPLAVSGLAAAYAFDRNALADHAIGAVAGFALFGAVAVLYRRVRHRDGLGLGDAKLLGALGAWVSWQGLPTVVFYGAILALAVTLVRSLSGRGLSAVTRISFGTFLALGGWLVWLYGPLVPG